jgi:hypothetical protein
MRQGVEWVLAYAAVVLALAAPALDNGFPITYHDTGGYVARAMELGLAPGRSLFYGLFLAAASLGWRWVWGPVLVQALATAWCLHLVLRSAAPRRGPLLVAGTGVAIAALTGGAWSVSQWMPDCLVPLLALALWLLAFRTASLARWERAGLSLLVALAVLSHMATLALAAGLTLAIVLLAAVAPHLALPRPRLAAAAGPVLAAVLAMPAASWGLTGTFAYTPGGATFMFSRLVQDGLVARFLADHCPSPEFRLCSLRHRLPATADMWIWHNESPFWALGGWRGAEGEMRRIAWESLVDHPGLHAAAAAGSLWQQLLRVRTGDGLDQEHEDTFWRMAQYLPQFAAPYLAAAQQQGRYTAAFFARLNVVQGPAGLASELAAVILTALGLARRRADWALMGGFMLLALLGNAFICGVLSNPHDRYQNRIAWLGLVALVAALAPAPAGQPQPLQHPVR